MAQEDQMTDESTEERYVADLLVLKSELSQELEGLLGEKENIERKIQVLTLKIDRIKQILKLIESLYGKVKTEEAQGAEEETGLEIPKEIADMKIEELNLLKRAYNALYRVGAHKVGNLLRMDMKDLVCVRNLGPKMIEHIRSRLEALDLLKYSRLAEQPEQIDVTENRGDT